MKANEITQDGYYWCSHGLWVDPISAAEPKWEVVEFSVSAYGGGVFYACGSDYPIELVRVPDFASFIGPIDPPSFMPGDAYRIAGQVLPTED